MKVPESKYTFRHRTPVQMRFNDIDMFGHLNNSVYLQFCDLAKMQYFIQFMDGKFDPRRLGMVVANINCDFYHPTRIDEDLTVLTAVAEIGNSSVAMEQRVVHSHDEVKCVCRTIMVSFDPSPGASVPVTDFWREAITGYESHLQ